MSTDLILNPRRFLIHDEVEEMTSADESIGVIPYRVRIWCHKDATPIVLVSEMKPWLGPDFMTGKMAWYVISAILNYMDDGNMAYFEDEPLSTKKLRMVTFDYAGCRHRRRPYNPKRNKWAWGDFVKLIGGPVDR